MSRSIQQAPKTALSVFLSFLYLGAWLVLFSAIAWVLARGLNSLTGEDILLVAGAGLFVWVIHKIRL